MNLTDRRGGKRDSIKAHEELRPGGTKRIGQYLLESLELVIEADWQEIRNVLPSANLACNVRYPALFGKFYPPLQVKHVYLRMSHIRIELAEKGVASGHTLYAHKLS